MTREAFIDRLRAWAQRADNEAAYSTDSTQRAWRGQASVLHGMAGAGVGDDVAALRHQLFADRQKAIVAWERSIGDEATIAQYAGEVQAYDLILELLRDANDGWSA